MVSPYPRTKLPSARIDKNASTSHGISHLDVDNGRVINCCLILCMHDLSSYFQDDLLWFAQHVCEDRVNSSSTDCLPGTLSDSKGSPKRFHRFSVYCLRWERTRRLSGCSSFNKNATVSNALKHVYCIWIVKEHGGQLAMLCWTPACNALLLWFLHPYPCRYKVGNVIVSTCIIIVMTIAKCHSTMYFRSSDKY